MKNTLKFLIDFDILYNLFLKTLARAVPKLKKVDLKRIWAHFNLFHFETNSLIWNTFQIMYNVVVDFIEILAHIC